MAGRVVPTSFTVGKQVTIAGTAYDIGDSITNAAVQGLYDLDALLSDGTLVPNADQNHRRTALGHPTPWYLAPDERGSLA